MSEIKHTPGPWKIEHYLNQSFKIITDEYDVAKVISSTHADLANTDREMVKANAELIARAPSLLIENEKLREENEKFKKALEEIVAMSNKFSAIHLKAASAIYD